MRNRGRDGQKGLKGDADNELDKDGVADPVPVLPASDPSGPKIPDSGPT